MVREGVVGGLLGVRGLLDQSSVTEQDLGSTKCSVGENKTAEKKSLHKTFTWGIKHFFWEKIPKLGHCLKKLGRVVSVKFKIFSKEKD